MRKLLLLLLFPLQLFAQPLPFSAFKNYPFTTELCAAATGERIAWAMDEQGRRNVYVAEGPAFTPRMLTHFQQDDGQEISSLSISADGRWVMFVRGGDHGANWDDGLPVNPLSAVTPLKVQVALVPFAGGDVKFIAEGDYPAFSSNNRIAFIKSGQVWTLVADSSAAPVNAFTMRGTADDLSWSPDGSRLAFVSNRAGHAIIGVYTAGDSSIQWIAPSFAMDGSPQWSPDGKSLVFIRRPSGGGKPDSLLARKHRPWSIMTASLNGNTATELWKAPETLAGSFPTTHGNANLHWAAGNKIVFLSYHDGWPHLYAINASGGAPLLLTPGSFMCEHIKLSADGKTLLCSANTGADPLDIDRRHVIKIDIEKPSVQAVSSGAGLEWTPVMTGDGKAMAFISATAQRPPLPAVLSTANMEPVLLAADHIPAAFPQQQLVTPRQVILTAADGVKVHAQLFTSGNGAAKKPAIVYIHGGPPRQMLLGWNYSDYYANAYACNQYLASLGFVVLSVNYRLGIGYGFNFHQPAHAGSNGADEYLDIKAAGTWLQQQSFVNPAKIGVYGGSYGGFLTAMALAKDSKLFAAGVDIHGVHDWVGRSSLLTAFDNSYEKAPDYAAAVKLAWQSSPVAYMKTWKSPVLVIHGDDDRNVAFYQSIDLISRLQAQHIPYETMMIVDDTHHWMKNSNAVKVYGAVAAYFLRKLQ
ncbi:MAG TPA: prolyl oligopeptidase family serine peptidase [Chitinophagaceae bacterium]|nr:prolyl oligopeptidase family serine peptidase [Chitinophagaceae bacterium]